MIISHSKKFVLIDVPKTASTSLNYFFLPLLDYGDLFSYPYYRVEGLNTKATPTSCDLRHTTYENLLNSYPIIETYFKFAFVRNPWSRMVSWYEFCLRLPLRPRSTMISPSSNKFRPISFDTFLNTHDHCPQLDWVSLNGVISLDFVGKFENLINDFNHICEKLSIPNPTLPHENKSSYQHYSTYYTEDLKNIVHDHYADDINEFNYVFNT